MMAKDGAAPDRDAKPLNRISRAVQNGKRQPLELWNPPFCGAIDMTIDREGRWFYCGSLITREALVRLFASLLKREGEGYFLVTPVEKLGIKVADVPFLAVEMGVLGAGPERRLMLCTNVGDVVEVGPNHALRFDVAEDGGLIPYVHVRGGLEARFTRSLLYQLAELIEDNSTGIMAGGQFHPIPLEALA